MAPTTRSRGATRPTGSTELDFNEEIPTSATKKSRSTENKVYRRAPPEGDLQQLQFPAKKKTVRAKKTRRSLPNPISAASKRNKNEGFEALKQETLTQMRWTDSVVPSTFRSDEEGMSDTRSEKERLVVDLTAEDIGENIASVTLAKASSAGKIYKKTVPTKQSAEVRKTISRGRKRRKTTGDLERDIRDAEDKEEEELSGSKYHTQTLTQMTSWKRLAEMAGEMAEGGLDEEARFGSGDGVTPPSKKRKWTSPIAELENTAPQQAVPQPPESTVTSSIIPETPSRQRAARVEIPSSQPSPFTPNLELGGRYWSPLGICGLDRTPLKERSTNVDAPTPTVRKISRNEIPDSWSTVNGGMPSPDGNPNAKREPLREIHWADVSIELGENQRDQDVRSGDEQNGERASQRTAEDVIMDSDDEFEGFPDLEIEAPGRSPSRKQQSQGCRPEQSAEGKTHVELTTKEANVEEADGSSPLEVDDTTVLPVLCDSTSQNKTQEKSAEIRSADADEAMCTAKPVEHITAPAATWAPAEFVPAGSRPDTSDRNHHVDFVELEAEEVVRPTPSGHKPPTQQSSSQPVATHRSSVRQPSTEEEAATPTQAMHRTASHPLSSQAVTKRSPTPGVAREDDETEPETPAYPRRRPSSSSFVEKETPLSSPQKASPVMPPISQLGYKSQAYESQRVPFVLIQQMAPQTDRSDVIISADFDEVKMITEGTCTHLFRDFRIPRHVVRIWIYITAPVCRLKYMAVISDWKMPGDINPEDQGVGTAEFNASEGTKYAYELMQVYELNNPVSLERMKEDGWVEQAPLATAITYVPPGPLGALMGNLKWALFEERSVESPSHSLGAVTVSQEVAEQLRSDIEHSTQLTHGRLVSSPPKQRPHLRTTEELQDDEQVIVPSSQDAMEDHVRDATATPIRTKFSVKKQVVFARPKAPHSHSQQRMIETEDGPLVIRHSSQQSQQQYIIKSTVRPSQATTVSAPSQSQPGERTTEYLTIPDSPSPVRPLAANESSSLPMVVDDSPIQMPTATSCGHASHEQSSSLGLGALLASSQGFGLAGMGGEQDSLMDDSKIRMPPDMEDVIWDSEGE